MLISFFGIDNLLIVQSEGAHASYDPGYEALELARNLPTKQEFFKSYRNKTRSIPRDLLRTYEKWIMIVNEQYRKAEEKRNPLANTAALSSVQLKFIYSQVVPKVVDFNGNVIFTCISSRVPPNFDMNETIPFLSSASKYAGKVICDHLSRLEAYQEGSRSWAPKSYADSFPFLDITPRKTTVKDLDAVQEECEQANYYMCTTRPLITVAISKASAKFAFSHFIYSHGFIQDQSIVHDFVGVSKRVFICRFF